MIKIDSSMNNDIKNIFLIFNKQQMRKIEDFLLSEIDSENLQETIDFIESSDEIKTEKFKDSLYDGDKYIGLYLEGNQYLISGSKNIVLIIDILSEEHGVDRKYTRIEINKENFIYLISNKQEAINCLKKYL